MNDYKKVKNLSKIRQKTIYKSKLTVNIFSF